jgi:hypothetical protein
LYWAVNEGAEQDDETLIGELPHNYNWLVDWYDSSDASNAKLVRLAIVVWRARSHLSLTFAILACDKGSFHRWWPVVS